MTLSMMMGCSYSDNAHGGIDTWDGWRCYTKGSRDTLANRTGLQRPKFLAYSESGSNLGGASPNYNTIYTHVLADLNAFYYTTSTGQTHTGRWGIKLYWSNGNENHDKGALSLPHTTTGINNYIISQSALYDACHYIDPTTGSRRFPDAYAGSNPTHDAEKTGIIEDWLHPSAPWHDFVMWSMYPPGRGNTEPDPTYNWPTLIEANVDTTEGFLLRCYRRTKLAQDVAGHPLIIGTGEIATGDDPDDTTTRPYYAVHGMAWQMHKLSVQYSIQQDFACWWDQQKKNTDGTWDLTAPQDLLSSGTDSAGTVLLGEPASTSPSTADAWLNWLSYCHFAGGTHPASWAGNPKATWKTSGTAPTGLSSTPASGPASITFSATGAGTGSGAGNSRSGTASITFSASGSGTGSNPPSQSITYQGAGAIAANTVAAATLSLAYPTGIAANDVIVAIVGAGGATPPPAFPGDWVQQSSNDSGGSSPSYTVATKVATGTESGSISVDTPSTQSQGCMYLLRNVSTASVLDTLPGEYSNSATSTAFVMPGVTTTRPGTLLFIATIGNGSSGTWTTPTTPATFTEVTDSNAANPHIGVDYLVWSGSGATGDITVTHSTAVRGAGVLMAFRPAVIAGTSASGAATLSLSATGAAAQPASATASISFSASGDANLPSGGPNITYEGAGSAAFNSSPGSTLTVPYPASGIQANDVLILAVGTGSATQATTPSGWTLLAGGDSGGTSPALRLFGKVAAGTENGINLNVTTPNAQSQGRMFLFRGVSTTTMLDTTTSAYGNSAGATAYDIPAITTTRAGTALIVFGVGNGATGTFTPPTVPGAFIEVWDSISANPNSGFSYLIWSGSGSTGTVNLVKSNSIRGGALLAALRPANSGTTSGAVGEASLSFIASGAAQSANARSGSASLSLTASVLPYVAPVLMRYADFETNDENFVTWFSTIVGRNSTNPHSGTSSLNVISTSTNFGIYAPGVNNVPWANVTFGKSYELSLWVRQESGSVPINMTFDIDWTTSGTSPIDTSTYDQTYTISNTWTKYTIPFTVDRDTATGISLWIYSANANAAYDGAVFRVDDIQLLQVPENQVAAAVSGSGSLSLSATGAAASVRTGSASLTFAGSTGTVPASITGTAALTLSGSGTARGAAASTASLSLSGTGTGRGRAIGGGSATLLATASVNGGLFAFGTASIAVTGTGPSSVRAPSSNASLTLSGTGSGRARLAANAATLTFAATGQAVRAVTATAAITITGTGLARGRLTANAASITITAQPATIRARVGMTALLTFEAVADIKRVDITVFVGNTVLIAHVEPNESVISTVIGDNQIGTVQVGPTILERSQ